ncbi:MAG: hypothetical protein M3211_04090 [Actinomycetota bacterium]|nr:hypothetical protein [Actinomycetota bacterium]
MRVRVNCERCGPVAVRPQDVTLLRHTGSPSRGLFDCPVCARVRTTAVARHALAVLVARGATEATDAPDPHEAVGLADLQRLQAALQDDEALREALDAAH